MSIVYFDTSALLKRYVTEPGSYWVHQVLSGPNAPSVFTSRLTRVEAICGFARRLRAGTLPALAYPNLLVNFNYDFDYKYNLVDITETLIQMACRLADKHPLRAYDAIQLTTALSLNQELLKAQNPPLTFISADDRLLEIAKAENLPTENPNNYP